MSQILVQIGAENILDRTNPQTTMCNLLFDNKLQNETEGARTLNFRIIDPNV